MKTLLFTILSAAMFAGIGDIAEINRLKKEAEQAYLNGNFSTAISHYHTLLDSFKVSDENIRLNLANAYLQTNDTATAQQYYRQLANIPDRQVKSLAQQQMGVIANDQQKTQESLQHFKEALKADPSNEDARYNYELLKKKLQEQQNQQENNKDQQKNDENKEQQKQDQNQQEQKQDQQQQQDQKQQEQKQQEGQEQESENKDQQEQDKQQKDQNQGKQEEGDSKEQKEEPIIPTAERLEDMNMSEEKARMILEAMRNNELQYIQQNRRKATAPPDRNKPDW